MSPYRNILNMLCIVLVMGSGVAIASDDNPWSMDETGDRQSLYYDLNGGGASGSFVPKQGFEQSKGGRAAKQSHRPNETIRPKSSSPTEYELGTEARGKQNRDQVFGYSGAQPKGKKTDPEATENGRYGAFPSENGQIKENKKFGIPARENGGIQFQGKSFGAFPPHDKKAKDSLRQKLQKNLIERQKLLQQRSSGFANVLPPPIPDPVPPRMVPYPNRGYGTVPGTGPGYGAGFAPPPGVGLPGNLYGPSFVDPGNPGYSIPGFMY